MSDQALIHVTVQGDRWDLLAWRYYRDPLAYERIIDANPGVPIAPVLPGALRLVIPVLTTTDILTTDLPPWKR